MSGQSAEDVRLDPLVEVVWEDTTNVAAWQTREEMIEWAKAGGWIARNIGYLVYEDAECVVVAARTVQDEERHVGLAERIPRQAILHQHLIAHPGCTCPDGQHRRSNRDYDMTQIDGPGCDT